MKVFRYQLNPNGEGPAGRLPAGSLTGYYSDPYYYGAAMIDNFDGLEEFVPEEVTPLEFNTLFTVTVDENGQPISDPIPALVAFQETVRKHFAEQLKQLVTPYTAEERETWFIQLKEAQDYLVSNTASTPMLSSIASVRGYLVADMVQGVVDKNTVYTTAVGTVLGNQQKIVESLWVR